MEYFAVGLIAFTIGLTVAMIATIRSSGEDDEYIQGLIDTINSLNDSIESKEELIESQQKMIALQKIAIDAYKDVLEAKEIGQ